MKALVLSDSHGNRHKLEKLLQRLDKLGSPDTLIYCGDGLSDILPIRQLFQNTYAVYGNCDVTIPADVPAQRVEVLSGQRVLIAHGNGFHVKRDLYTIAYRAKEVEAGIVCFGHNHRQTAQWLHGALLLNPGPFQDGYFALLTIEGSGEIKPELCKL